MCGAKVCGCIKNGVVKEPRWLSISVSATGGDGEVHGIPGADELHSDLHELSTADFRSGKAL